ncbi:MAG: hypothetical protein SCK29_12645 [Bacillota bacterium]|nr:hypothetical protein [Bacillota bacterium]MDW7684949.1 hypothetical protein [Bacillota bacterium]
MLQKPYYLVAIPEGEIMGRLRRLQTFLSRRFRMYRAPYPGLHLTVGVIEDVHKISDSFSLLRDITAEHPPFSVNIEGERCFDEPFLSVGVDIVSEKLAYLSGEVEGALSNAGLTPRTFNRWNFHISLIHPQFARRAWSREEFQEACQIVKEYAPHGCCQLTGLELWEPEFPPLNVVERFSFSS